MKEISLQRKSMIVDDIIAGRASMSIDNKRRLGADGMAMLNERRAAARPAPAAAPPAAAPSAPARNPDEFRFAEQVSVPARVQAPAPQQQAAQPMPAQARVPTTLPATPPSAAPAAAPRQVASRAKQEIMARRPTMMDSRNIPMGQLDQIRAQTGNTAGIPKFVSSLGKTQRRTR